MLPQNILELNIGYVPMNDASYHPFDLKNFIFFARKRKLNVEIFRPDKEYDLIVLSPKADLSIWSQFPRGNTKIIFCLVDSYLALEKWGLKNVFRGLGKFLSGEQKYLKWDYLKALIETCERADGMICTTEEQKKIILNYCTNVHIILEFNFNIARCDKKNYANDSEIKIAWEGRPENIEALREIKGPLIKLNKTHKLSLHVITDLEYKKYTNKFFNVSVINQIKKIFGDEFQLNTVTGNSSLVYFYQWNTEMVSKIITGCDFAIIPFLPNQPLFAGKPENKLLLFWRMGMPTIVAAIPSYIRAMKKCGLDMYCNNEMDWIKKIEKYIVDPKARKKGGEIGKNFADRNYSEEKYLSQWDQVLMSIFSLPS